MLSEAALSGTKYPAHGVLAPRQIPRPAGENAGRRDDEL